VPEVLSARRFEVVDTEGRVRAVVGNLSGSSSEWYPGVALLDEDGHERVSLMLGASGPLLTFAEAGNVALELGVFDEADPESVAPGPCVVVCDRSGTARWSVRLDADGHAVVTSEDGTA
jgi:hypothetical protein